VRLQVDGSKERSVKGCTIPLKPGSHVVIKPHSNNVIRDIVVAF